MAKGSSFDKFIHREEKGAKKKEKIRQEKKQAREKTKEYFNQLKASKRKPADAGVSQPENKPGKKILKKNIKGKKDSPQAPAGIPAKSKENYEFPLNKYLAHAGICSRRDAVELIKKAQVTVNGAVVTEPGFKVSSKDLVTFNGKKITPQKTMFYILLNKPKDYITTTEDPQGRKTVLDLIKNATHERVYPIGRLDRNTTGVLLLTNDGELAQKLSHPKYMVKKIYEVKLDKPLIKKDFDTLLTGVTLEDGFISPDALAYADSKDKSVIGIEIHSGRNRIVRRMFESLGYDVRNLDRVMYAGLTKKNVERGKWRYLAEKEIRILKYLNSSYNKNKQAKGED